MGYQETITFILEMIGTVAFAASGALVGSEQKMDIFGVTVLGVITAVGGGMIRDVTLGIIPPGVFQKPVYAAVAVLTSVLVFFLLYFKRELLEGNVTYDKVMLVMDSVGLGIFTVVGVNTGIRQGFADNIFLLVFVGTITGVGGGLLRDMMAEVPPYIFVKHIYACASIVGAIVCVYTYRLFGVVASLIFGSAAVILMRYLAAHYRWNLPKLSTEQKGVFMIRAENLSYSFPHKELYNKISFTLEDDVHCAFIGTNGTGKSTLVNMILHPEDYLYDGKLIIDVPGQIGYVSQFYAKKKK